MDNIVENTCPSCGYKTDSALSVTQEVHLPKEGDISFCIKCGQIGIFDENLKIKALREDQLYKICTENPDIKQTILEIHSVFAFLNQNKDVQSNSN